MAFRVDIAPQAFDDIDSIAAYIIAQSGLRVAEAWFNGIMSDIASLQEMPARCFKAPEAEELGCELRILLHGRRNRTYKIYFAITHDDASSGIVSVFHVRHWARKPVEMDELEELMEEIADSTDDVDKGPL
jgi:plasmid stabilization system protein ParE